MTKKLLWALILIVITVLVLLFNRGNVDVNLLIGKISAMKALVFLGFTGLGVVIGCLLK